MTPKEILELFNEKFARLDSSSLIKHMTKKGWCLSFNFKTGNLDSNAMFPNLENIESYVLNLRFFIQDNEPISIRNLSEFYKSNCLKSENIDKFEELRKVLNAELNKEWSFRFNNQVLLFRDIFEGFIYANIAHSKFNSHDKFKNLTKDPFAYHLALDSFLRAINLIHDILTAINHLNHDSFENLY